MARSVSINYSNFRLGTNVTIARRLVDVTFTFTDNNGVVHTPPMRTFTFPDDLALIPAAEREDMILQMALAAERRNQAVDA